MDAACDLRRQSKAAQVEDALHDLLAEPVMETGYLVAPVEHALHEICSEPVVAASNLAPPLDDAHELDPQAHVEAMQLEAPQT